MKCLDVAIVMDSKLLSLLPSTAVNVELPRGIIIFIFYAGKLLMHLLLDF